MRAKDLKVWDLVEDEGWPSPGFPSLVVGTASGVVLLDVAGGLLTLRNASLEFSLVASGAEALAAFRRAKEDFVAVRFAVRVEARGR